MINILIADDEKLIRAGIIKIIHELFPDTVCTAECRNGSEALEYISTNSTDILITDIRMPVMDGLSLMERISPLDSPPEIIVLSGYDDFSYAKQAIQHGARLYILKPVDKNELFSYLSSIIDEIHQKKRKKDQLVISQIYEDGRLVSRSADSHVTTAELPIVCVYAAENGTYPLLSQIPNDIPVYTIEKQQSSVSFIISEKYMTKLLDILKQKQCTAGVSLSSSNFSSIKILHRQSFIAYLRSFFSADGDRLFTFSSDAASSDTIAVHEKIYKASALIGSSDTEALKTASADCFQTVHAAENPSAASFLLYTLYESVLSDIVRRFWEYNDRETYLYAKSIMIEQISSCSAFLEWQKNVIDYIIYLDTVMARDRVEHPFIAKALEFIEKNYMNNINMAAAANFVSTNYTYFSEKFKEHTGINFNEYLKRLRINEAKMLLEKGCFKVYEVASRAGFGDVKYFMKIFKEETGLSPSEYRKKTECT